MIHNANLAHASRTDCAGFSFEGVLPDFIDPASVHDYINGVSFLLYQQFPQDSDIARVTDPIDLQQGTANVVTRLGSPADNALLNSSANLGTSNFEVTSLGQEDVTVPIAVGASNIVARPGQLQSGSAAPSSFIGKVRLTSLPTAMRIVE